MYPKRMPNFTRVNALNPHYFEIAGEEYEYVKGQYFKKVATLKAGDSFGEMALNRRCR